jgi:hypothetical protein
MNRPTHMDTLFRLEEQLRHFDRCPDFGDAEAVAAIRQHLLVRIREAESLMRSGIPIQANRASRAEAA